MESFGANNTAANIIANFTSGPAPLTVTFTVDDPNGELNQEKGIIWHFGDGASTKNDIFYAQHTYTVPGTYVVTASVFDSEDKNATLAGFGIVITVTKTTDPKKAGFDMLTMVALAGVAFAMFMGPPGQSGRTGKKKR